MASAGVTARVYDRFKIYYFEGNEFMCAWVLEKEIELNIACFQSIN